jgi:hypothetical protein
MTSKPTHHAEDFDGLGKEKVAVCVTSIAQAFACRTLMLAT